MPSARDQQSEPFVKFYAGMPLINPEGYALGTLCIFDFRPRDLAFETGEAIRRLARQVVAAGLAPNEAFRTAQTGGGTIWALPT